jgi:hypothetical protein
VMLTDHPRPGPPLDDLLENARELDERIGGSLTSYALPMASDLASLACGPRARPSALRARFANGLELTGHCWASLPPLEPGTDVVLVTSWRVASPLTLPDTPVVANPPPPGVYSGPRLAVFTHLLTGDGNPVAGDDGLWVDPLTLGHGDRFILVHHFAVASTAPDGPYLLAIGLYDPKTGARWPVLDAEAQSTRDRVVFPVDGPAA